MNIEIVDLSFFNIITKFCSLTNLIVIWIITIIAHYKNILRIIIKNII